MGRKKKKRVKNGSPRRDLEARAEEIIDKGVVVSLGNDRFWVAAQSKSGRGYEVTFLEDWKCSCAYHVKRHTDCKHIIAVQMLVMDIRNVEPIDLEIAAPEIKCPDKACGSTDCNPYEMRPRKKGGESPRYRCQKCRKRFTYRPGALGRHYPMEVITDILDDVTTGKSLKSATRSIEKRSYPGVKTMPARNTALRWIQDAKKATDKIYRVIRIPVSGKWTTDEIHFKTMGKGKYLYGIMCWWSRFVIAIDISEEKLHYDANGLFVNAVEVAGMIPGVMINDKLPGFGKAYRNVMGKKRRHPVPESTEIPKTTYQIRAASVKKRHINNNRRERLNGTVKDRIKTVRGFSSEEPALLGLLVTFYNFLKPHESLKNKPPAEEMGIRVRGPDRWASLLAYASTC